MAKVWSVTKFGDANLLVSYKDLDDPFTMEIPLQITNNAGQTLFFQLTGFSLPAAYTNSTQNLGSVASGGSFNVLGTALDRARPTVRTDETITLRLKAFTDAGFTIPFSEASQQDLALTVRLFDHSSLTLVDKDDFDNNSQEGWTTAVRLGGAGPVVSTPFFSAPYCLWAMQGTGGAGGNPAAIDAVNAKKSFTIGAVTRAFCTLHIKLDSAGSMQTYIKVGGTVKIPLKALELFGLDRWVRLVFILPVSATTEVFIGNESVGGDSNMKSAYLDDVWVVTE